MPTENSMVVYDVDEVDCPQSSILANDVSCSSYRKCSIIVDSHQERDLWLSDNEVEGISKYLLLKYPNDNAFIVPSGLMTTVPVIQRLYGSAAVMRSFSGYHNQEVIIFPYVVRDHWEMMIAFKPAKRILFVESKHNFLLHDLVAPMNIIKYICDDIFHFDVVNATSLPWQYDSFNCGIYILQAIELFLQNTCQLDTNFGFDNADMLAVRHKFFLYQEEAARTSSSVSIAHEPAAVASTPKVPPIKLRRIDNNSIQPLRLRRIAQGDYIVVHQPPIYAVVTDDNNTSHSNVSQPKRKLPKRKRLFTTPLSLRKRASKVTQSSIRCKQQRHDLLHRIAFGYQHEQGSQLHHSSIGGMNAQCVFCGAMRFKCEPVGICCQNGSVDLPSFPALPEPLQSLYSGDDRHCSAHFLSHIRRYNGCFCMTSFGCNDATVSRRAAYFRVQGQVYHKIGSLLPDDNQNARFLQVYFMDNSEDQVAARCHEEILMPAIIRQLGALLSGINQYVLHLTLARELVPPEQYCQRKIVLCEDRRPAGEHRRRYNAVVSDEIAVLMHNEPTENRDIVIHYRNGRLQRISELHAAYDSLQYPLLFPYGTDSYHIYLQNRRGRNISICRYYCYHLMVRNNNYLLRARALFQQFIVDAYCKIETSRLQYIRLHQRDLRADTYNSLRDSLLRSDDDPQQVGQRIILPASYVGSPRYMAEKRNDAMSYVRHFGKADLFITFTCNPKWTEILANLLPNQSFRDRPDIVVRVFNAKQQRLMHLIKQGVLGSVRAWLYTVEYQKRGLPHAHILLWLQPSDKIRPHHIDQVVSAEIPSPVDNPSLHEYVIAHMVHGPCGTLNPNCVCMQKGRCSKRFPKLFTPITIHANDEYPRYRRRSPQDGGISANIRMRRNGQSVQQAIDNRWIVPYNAFLLLQFNCHVNVEICSSLSSIKYVLKYVTKGCDQAVFQLQQNDATANAEQQQHDEIAQFHNARYVSSTEAAWHIFRQPSHEHYPPVISLQVHLENGQRVLFTRTTAAQVANAEPPVTTLTAFFKRCCEDEFCRSLKYVQVPEFYTWNSTSKTWQPRRRGKSVNGMLRVPAIGRIYTVHPRAGECYYLRLLLNEVVGPRSFEELRTVNNQVFSTYQEAAAARGLLMNDMHLQLSLQEAQYFQTPHRMRFLFAIILAYCEPNSGNTLWLQFRNALSEDILRRVRQQQGLAEFTDEIYNQALCLIEDKLLSLGGHQIALYGLPQPIRVPTVIVDEQHQQHYNPIEAAKMIADLTEEQRAVFNDCLAVVDHRGTLQGNNIIFIDAPGGTGKSYLINCLLYFLRSQNRVAVATASSGIAATLLLGGRTLHSTFKVPVDVHNRDQSTCNVTGNSPTAHLIRTASLVVVDEAPMLHRAAFEALDRTLRFIREVDQPMGGLPFLLVGDFRQILPVVRHGTRANIVDACLKRSYLWQYVTVKRLSLNMRAHLSGDVNAAAFANLLIQVGEGRIPSINSTAMIDIPAVIRNCVDNLSELKDAVYPNLYANAIDVTWLAERVIISPLNINVDRLNNWIMDDFPGESHWYESTDSALSEDEAVHYPVEFLNSIELSALPPHKLHLKIGCPVIIIRTIDPPRAMNGTRCVVVNLQPNLIEVRISSGPHSGETVLLPRVPLIPSDSDMGIPFRRVQFPIRPCFAMTINKAQGQSYKCIGVDLSAQCFTHGMLYVALSRTGSPHNLYIHTTNRQACNIVYTEVL